MGAIILTRGWTDMSSFCPPSDPVRLVLFLFTEERKEVEDNERTGQTTMVRARRELEKEAETTRSKMRLNQWILQNNKRRNILYKESIRPCIHSNPWKLEGDVSCESTASGKVHPNIYGLHEETLPSPPLPQLFLWKAVPFGALHPHQNPPSN